MLNKQHAARLREMAGEQAEQAEYAQSHGNVAEHRRNAAALLAGANALENVEVAKAALGDIANVGNSYCNEHDNVDCITCIHETCAGSPGAAGGGMICRECGGAFPEYDASSNDCGFCDFCYQEETKCTMTNEQKAKRLEQMAEEAKLKWDLSEGYSDAALLRESAALWREREGVRWEDEGWRRKASYKGYDLNVFASSHLAGQYVFDIAKNVGRAMNGYAPTLDAAKAAAVAWVDAQEGK